MIAELLTTHQQHNSNSSRERSNAKKKQQTSIKPRRERNDESLELPRVTPDTLFFFDCPAKGSRNEVYQQQTRKPKTKKYPLSSVDA